MGCGIPIGMHLSRGVGDDLETGEFLLALAAYVILFYLAAMMQIVIHEGGHLLFGLLTGYHFSSFRIGSFMWVKKEEGLRFCRFSLAGTGGQCLMAPPEPKEGKIPFVLYNLGGSMLNLISAVVFAGLYFLCRDTWFVSAFFLSAALTGAAFAALNGIPMRAGVVDNDGYNAFSLGKDPEALHAFWIQMKINEQVTGGTRLKDMPEAWFRMPPQESMKNSMVASIGVFSCNRMMDQKEFRLADQTMAELMEADTGMVGLHRSLLVFDRIYCELVGENRKNVIDGLWDDSLKKLERSMKNYPSILRVQYAYALLSEHDSVKAGKIRERFEKTARKYPNPGDIESERELMEYARLRAETGKE